MPTLPTMTRTIDDDFVNTWYEIRSQVIDNILNATPFSLALKEFGCMKTQVGGEYITRTVGYGTKSTQRIDKGSVLTQSVPKLDTMGIWDWRYFLVDVNRSIVDDAKNAGKFKIKSYIAARLESARNAVIQDMETYLHQWGLYYETPYQFNGLYDICPQYTQEGATSPGAASDDQHTSGDTSNGGLDRVNTWWRNWCANDTNTTYSASNKYAGLVHDPYTLNLVPDMRSFWNATSANKESPNLIIMDKAIYEAYEDEAGDLQTVVRSAFSKKAVDLGFDVLTFKGAPLMYSSGLDSTEHIFMLNMNHIEFVYNPNLWFDMTEWKSSPNQLERVAYIACMTTGLITDEPRRHCAIEYST